MFGSAHPPGQPNQLIWQSPPACWTAQVHCSTSAAKCARLHLCAAPSDAGKRLCWTLRSRQRVRGGGMRLAAHAGRAVVQRQPPHCGDGCGCGRAWAMPCPAGGPAVRMQGCLLCLASPTSLDPPEGCPQPRHPAAPGSPASDRRQNLALALPPLQRRDSPRDSLHSQTDTSQESEHPSFSRDTRLRGVRPSSRQWPPPAPPAPLSWHLPSLSP